MLASCPVIGVKNGGLLETVKDDKSNGILCEENINSFSEALYTLINNPQVIIFIFIKIYNYHS